MAEFKVGLEIHGYINTKKKLFCDCKNKPDDEPNTNTCPRCTGQPGSKPNATNESAITKSIQIGLMLGCEINPQLLFQRKHYSWPDSPNNYQRTMSGSYALPVGTNGMFEGIRITEVHLEEDPAKWDPLTGEIDYNRAGVPLIEIVTEPDFSSSEQVKDWLKKLVTTLSYIKAVNKDAGTKSDVNVSIAPEFERVEIKNVNSQSAIVSAIEFEVKRQEQEKAQGKEIPMQTRTWTGDETVMMRKKETASDYMFIPDPDIPFIDISQKEIETLKKALPQTPSQKQENLIEMGVSEDDAKTISLQYELVDMFEEFSKEIPIQLLITYLRREVVRVANYNKLDVDELTLDKTQLHTLLKLVSEKKITDNVAQKIMNTLLLKPFDVKEHLEKEGLLGVTVDLTSICQKVITDNPKPVQDYKSGNENSINFLVGQVMRQTRGAAAPDIVLSELKKLL